MKISLITETFPPEINGVAMTLHRVVEGLLARGHEVEVVCPYRTDRLDFFPLSPFRLRMVRGLPIPRYSDLRFGLPAHRILRKAWTENRPDLVHIATEGPLGWSAERMTQRLRLPFITTFHTNFHSYGSHYGYGVLKPAVLWWLRRSRRRALRTFVPSAQLRDELAEEGFRNLSILSRGVDVELFTPARRDPTLRASWGARDDTPVALYVGRVAGEKNIPLTIRAWQKMRDQLPGLRLVVVGDGPDRKPLAKKFPEIVFTGPRRGEDLARHYASGDVFLFASVTETFGNVVTEALASGLVVLTYDYAAGRQHIRSGANGFTAPFGDSEAFLGMAEQIAAERAAWPALGRAARKTSEGISWNAVLNDFTAEIESLVSSPTRALT